MNQKKQFSVVEKLFIIMAWKLNGMSQGAAYEGWNNSYARKSAKEYWTDSTRQLQGWTFGIDDLQEVSARELKFLGFRQWVDETTMLLPLWLYPHMDKTEKWHCINGKDYLLDGVDLDTRGGCLAYYFIHAPVALLPEEPEDKTDEVDPANGEGTFTEAQLNAEAEAEAWANDISGGEDDEPMVHPFRDDEHQ